MDWVNITAKTLPEAIDRALDSLGVDEADAEIEVLEEPRQGLFRSRGDARVRARVKPKQSRPKENRNRKRKGDGGGGRSRDRNRNRKRSGGDGDGRNRSDRGAKQGGGRDNGGARNDDGQHSGARNDRQDRQEQGRGRGGRGDGGRNRSGNGGNQNKGETPVKEATMEEVSEQVENFLQGLVDAMGVDGGVRIDDDGDEGIIGVVEGQHGLMIGPRGRTLEAIQELTRVTAQRSAPSNIRIKVDVGGYRAIRAQALQTFAAKAAEEALADGKERVLEPMNSVDRKIVHDALTDTEGIETRSAGTDPNRRVVVVPVGAAADDDEGDESAEDVAEASADEAVEAVEAEGGEESDTTEAAVVD